MKTLLIILISLTTISGFTQELNCNITVNSSRIQGSNKEVFTTLQESLNNFMNNTVWTNYLYDGEERIECNILLDITSQSSANEFEGKLQIQSRRPVFGSSYSSPLMNYVDEDVKFSYQEFDAIALSENSFVSSLSSLLSFYAYIIIGLDSDSFSLKGGEVFFQKAEKIVNAAQSSGYVGWQGSDDTKRKNRYWLIENMLDSEYEPLRDFTYNYHRQGLDLMEKSADRGRSGVTEAIRTLEKFNNNKPDPFTYLLTIILETKANEFVDIYTGAPDSEKQQVKKILMDIDPAGSRKYSKLGE